jgi:molecular chaperone IbpA
MEMRTAYDFSPLYRSMIGVDRLADLIEAAMRSEGDVNYPPYDIEKTGEDSYRVSMAAAGFRPDEIEIVSQPNLLIVAGHKAKTEEGRTFLHRGIAARDFERRFELADHVVVRSAAHADGVLTIELAREVPEALKPRRIPIGASNDQGAKKIENRKSEPRAA